MPFIIDRTRPAPLFITKKIIEEGGGGGDNPELLKELAYYKDSCKLIKYSEDDVEPVYDEEVLSE